MLFRSNVAAALGLPWQYASAAEVRRDIAARYADRPELAGLSSLGFGRPTTAKNWLQASNPSERWKWDFMFQDLPPVKFGEDFGPLPRAEVIPLREVK